MKKILVTGASGFVGKYLVKELINSGYRIIIVGRSFEEFSNNNIQKVRCSLENIEELEQLIEDRDIEACIHLAWSGSNGDERANDQIQLLNVKYSLNLIRVLAQMHVKRFIGVGTLAEKDVLNYSPINGSTPNKTSYYGVAKIASHFMTKAECNSLGIEHLWCQLSNLYGIGDKTDNFINFATKIFLEGRRASFTSGEQFYDFIYITDAVRALRLICEKGYNNCNYFIGSNQPKKLKEYIKIMRNRIDKSIPLYLGEIPYNGISLLREDFSCEAVYRDTGFKSVVDFESGYKKIIDVK